MTFDLCEYRMHVPCVLEWVEHPVCRRRLRHASCPRNHSQMVNIRRCLQDINDAESQDATTDDRFRVVFTDLGQLEDVALRPALVRESSGMI